MAEACRFVDNSSRQHLYEAYLLEEEESFQIKFIQVEPI